MGESQNNTMLVWLAYLSSSAIFGAVFFQITKTDKFKFLSSVMRAVFLSLAYTPWYVTEASDSLAPALMIFTLDLITGAGDPLRSLIPLLLSVFVLVGIASILRWQNFDIFVKRKG
jgi:hypothetical protein